MNKDGVLDIVIVGSEPGTLIVYTNLDVGVFSTLVVANPLLNTALGPNFLVVAAPMGRSVGVVFLLGFAFGDLLR